MSAPGGNKKDTVISFGTVHFGSIAYHDLRPVISAVRMSYPALHGHMNIVLEFFYIMIMVGKFKLKIIRRQL